MSRVCPSISISKSNTMGEVQSIIHHRVKVHLYYLKSSHTATWWEYLISSKKWANPNLESQTKWYATTKMHSDMVMPQCKLVSLRSITDEKVMPQCRTLGTIYEMNTIRYKLSRVFIPWSIHLKNPSTLMRGLCSQKTIIV